jgi:hypothetical protein
MEEKKLKIVLVVPPSRKDFYSQLSELENAEVYILWYVKKKADNAQPLGFIVGQYYWSDYRTPYSFLRKVKPDRIVFFEMIDLRQIALIISARSLKIPTFYLEHGAAGDKQTTLKRFNEVSFLKHKLPRLFRRFISDLPDIFSSKIFYYSVYKKFDSFRSYLKYLLLPVQILRAAPKKVLRKNIFRERVPDHLIVFSQINFEVVQLYTGIKKEDAFLTGLPFFDKYFSPSAVVHDYVVYIEHPYLEGNLLGWTPVHHKQIADELFEFAEKNKVKLYIKLHPVSNNSNWQSYSYNKEYVEIIQHGDFTQLYLEAKLILGFSSSLITGLLCAKKNIVLLGWHPEPGIFGNDFSKTGLCHVSFSPSELNTKYQYWVNHNLAQENEIAYNEFLTNCNYPFDGKATERVLKIITEHEVS